MLSHLQQMGRDMCGSIAIVKVKGKVVLVCMPSRHGGRVPHFLNIGTNWRWVVHFTTQHLYTLWKDCQHPLNVRLGGTHSWPGCFGQHKCFLLLPGICPWFHNCQLVVQSQLWLCYASSPGYDSFQILFIKVHKIITIQIAQIHTNKTKIWFMA
jgi:hypothetical protein